MVSQDLLLSPALIDKTFVSIPAFLSVVNNLDKCKFSTFVSVTIAKNLRFKRPSKYTGNFEIKFSSIKIS